MNTPGSYNYFGLYWGSLDTYNSIAFYNGGSLIGGYDGADIFPLLANGGQTSWASNRYVNFFFNSGDVFDRIVLTSTNYAFESDNHAFGNIRKSVPEPGTLAMFGLGLVGLGGRRDAARQRASRLASRFVTAPRSTGRCAFWGLGSSHHSSRAIVTE